MERYLALWDCYKPLFDYFDNWTQTPSSYLPDWKRNYVYYKNPKVTESVEQFAYRYNITVRASFAPAHGNVHIIVKEGSEKLEQTLTFQQLYTLSKMEKPK
mgnify:CR=1 FL=1